jgi:hypothetical protein
MSVLRPATGQQLTIASKLSRALGPEEYEDLFRHFICNEIIDGIAHVFVLNEFYATQIEALFCLEIIQAIEDVIGCEVTAVNILPIDFSNLPATTPQERLSWSDTGCVD